MATQASPTATYTQLSKNAFLGINWLLFSICVVGFAVRAYIRISVFRRLLAEDWLMIGALVLLAATNGLSQHYGSLMWRLLAWLNGQTALWATALTDVEAVLRACGSAIVMFIFGFYMIKVNFLLFFWRLGARVGPVFRIIWWVIFGLVMACGIVSITVCIPTFKCLFDGWLYTFTTCQTLELQSQFFTDFRISVALDVFTDALIIAFPTYLLWGVRISTKKKLALVVIFSLVGFTIVATILRGALLTSVFQQTAVGRTINFPWIWFWFHVELCVAFIVACIVSFRSLFAQRDQQSERLAVARRQRSAYYPSRFPNSGGERTPHESGNGSHGDLPGGGMRKRFLVFQDSILDTCEDLEGVSFDDASTLVEMERRTPLDPVAAHRGFEDEEAGLAVPPRQMQHGELGDLGHRRTTFSGPGEERDLEARPSFDSLMIGVEPSPMSSDDGRSSSDAGRSSRASRSSHGRQPSIDSLMIQEPQSPTAQRAPYHGTSR